MNLSQKLLSLTEAAAVTATIDRVTRDSIEQNARAQAEYDALYQRLGNVLSMAHKVDTCEADEKGAKSQNDKDTAKPIDFTADADDDVEVVDPAKEFADREGENPVAAQYRLEAFSHIVPAEFAEAFEALSLEEKINLAEPLTMPQISALEAQLDKLFAAVGVDVEFTRHFFDRVNDARNKKQITLDELSSLFSGVFTKWGKKLRTLGKDVEGVIKDMASDVNLPFVLNFNPRSGLLELIAKTVMRKKGFHTRPFNKVLDVNDKGTKSGGKKKKR